MVIAGNQVERIGGVRDRVDIRRSAVDAWNFQNLREKTDEHQEESDEQSGGAP